MDSRFLTQCNILSSSALLLLQAIYKPAYVFSCRSKLAPTIMVFIMLGLAICISQLSISAYIDVESLAKKQLNQFQTDGFNNNSFGGLTIAPEDIGKVEPIKQHIENSLYLIPINSLFLYPLFLVFVAVVLYLSQKVMHGVASMQDTIYITGFAFWPAFFINSVLSVIFVFLSTSFMNTEQASFSSIPLNLTFWLSQDTPKPIIALADSIDIFSIWVLILIIAGLSTVSKIDVKKTGILVTVLWGIFMAGKYFLVSLFIPEECFTCDALY